jgi:hypothetical protein
MSIQFFRRNKGDYMEHEQQNIRFPFGEYLHDVKQAGQMPKKVFVLGVYASAVHAKWISPEGKQISPALAVASEPCIFWQGDKEEAKKIIEAIRIPQEAGYLEPSEEQFNGPSGRALDAQVLAPLGYSRNDAWLCDLVPYSCRNDGQEDAIQKNYIPASEKFGLPVTNIPSIPTILANETRREEIVRELQESQATTIILLGDDPIKWFLFEVSDCKKTKLADFGESVASYGSKTSVTIAGKKYDVIALAHPRQIGALGSHSPKWHNLHQQWVEKQKSGI